MGKYLLRRSSQQVGLKIKGWKVSPPSEIYKQLLSSIALEGIGKVPTTLEGNWAGETNILNTLYLSRSLSQHLSSHLLQRVCEVKWAGMFIGTLCVKAKKQQTIQCPFWRVSLQKPTAPSCLWASLSFFKECSKSTLSKMGKSPSLFLIYKIICFMIVVVKRVCPHTLIHLFIPRLFTQEAAVKTNRVSSFLECLEGEGAITATALWPPEATTIMVTINTSYSSQQL